MGASDPTPHAVSAGEADSFLRRDRAADPCGATLSAIERRVSDVRSRRGDAPPCHEAVAKRRRTMASLWYQTGSGEWIPWQLDSAAVALGPRLLPIMESDGGPPSALLMRSRCGGLEQWLAMRIAARPLYVNGEPLRTGIRVINDRDEMRLGGRQRVFFSGERLPRVEPFAGGPREVLCPRCRRGIAAGKPIVRCGCGTAFHQDSDPEFQCFTYAPACPVCARPTELTDTYRWQPEA
jgi:hypothetical protein